MYHNYALRIAGPLLALGVNFPFLPPDLYDSGTSTTAVIEDGLAEHRITVFETSMNPKYAENKVRFPADLDSTAGPIERIAADSPIVPTTVEPTGRFDDRFGYFTHKHGTYWRWVWPGFDGESESAANVRVEFRPLPNQPTIRDRIGFTALFAGLLKRLVHADHPVDELPWESA